MLVLVRIRIFLFVYDNHLSIIIKESILILLFFHSGFDQILAAASVKKHISEENTRGTDADIVFY